MNAVIKGMFLKVSHSEEVSYYSVVDLENAKVYNLVSKERLDPVLTKPETIILTDASPTKNGGLYGKLSLKGGE